MSQSVTIGAELEIYGVSRRHLRNMLDLPVLQGRLPSFNIGDDGSLRGQTYTLGNVPIQPMSSKRSNKILPSGAVPAEVVGAELISEPTSYEKWLESAPLVAKLFGHLAVNPRSSIHTHTDFNGQSWRRIQNYISWFYHLEAPLYRLARMGQPQHRGVMYYEGTPNDHRYARPLSNPIGIPLHRRSSYVPCIDIAGVLSARSFSEMLAYWGRLDLYWNQLGHYCPHRLHGLNIVSLTRHGTIELRLFNGWARYFPQAIDITYGLYKLSENPVPKDFDPMPLGIHPKCTLTDIAGLLDMSPESLRPLWRIDGPREWVPGPEVRALAHHYSNDNSMWYKVDSSNPVNMVVNSLGQRDIGSDNFIPAPLTTIAASYGASTSTFSNSLRSRLVRMEGTNSILDPEDSEDDDNDDIGNETPELEWPSQGIPEDIREIIDRVTADVRYSPTGRLPSRGGEESSNTNFRNQETRPAQVNPEDIPRIEWFRQQGNSVEERIWNLADLDEFAANDVLIDDNQRNTPPQEERNQ